MEAAGERKSDYSTHQDGGQKKRSGVKTVKEREKYKTSCRKREGCCFMTITHHRYRTAGDFIFDMLSNKCFHLLNVADI